MADPVMIIRQESTAKRGPTAGKRIAGVFALVTAAFIWGIAFSAQRQGAGLVPSNVFLAIRSWIGCAVLFPLIVILDRINGLPVSVWGHATKEEDRRFMLKGGFCCGLVVFMASLLQQMGLSYATAGKAGFLTALYIVIVPVLGIFLKRRVGILLWFAVLLVLYGSWLLCAENGFGSMSKGDFLLIGCAFCYAAHITVIDHFVSRTDCVRLSWLQFLMTAVLATVVSFLAGESWNCHNIQQALPALLFCGIGSTGIAYTLQIAGQKSVPPVAACLIMSLESVFSVLGGWLVLDEILTSREICGCILIFIAVILAQLPFHRKEQCRARE